MIPRPSNSRPYNSRLDNLISWFAASIIVTAGVIYSLKLQEDRGKSKPERALARATPAQEPLTWQERRAADRGRGRRAHAPLRIPWRGCSGWCRPAARAVFHEGGQLRALNRLRAEALATLPLASMPVR
jgi:hypothetical protein